MPTPTLWLIHYVTLGTLLHFSGLHLIIVGLDRRAFEALSRHGTHCFGLAVISLTRRLSPEIRWTYGRKTNKLALTILFAEKGRIYPEKDSDSCQG